MFVAEAFDAFVGALRRVVVVVVVVVVVEDLLNLKVQLVVRCFC